MRPPTAARPRLGLVLSGGAVRGAAHVGVLKALDRHGLAPDLIAGTSAGAIIGAAYAAGHPPAAMEAFAHHLDWFSVVGPTLNLRTSLLTTRPMREVLSEEVGLTTFEDLSLPFCAVACDLASGEAVELDRGDLVAAVMASSAVPGLFPPQQVDGRYLVDGGIVANLPVDAARRRGVDVVVAVDLLPMGRGPDRPDRLFEIWQRSLYLMIRANHSDHGTPDCLIVPEIADFSFTDFREVEELVRRGEAAAEAALPEIRRCLAAAGAG